MTKFKWRRAEVPLTVKDTAATQHSKYYTDQVEAVQLFLIIIS